ncbi:hypothetical protein C2U42_21515 [Klebsiella oxytoca]|nr:hypothetical protein C2U42_21515 [Klebsiella oxytoca]
MRSTRFPGLRLTPYPGYSPPRSQEPVARARRIAPPREQSAEWQNFPKAMLRICSGYQTRRRR